MVMFFCAASGSRLKVRLKLSSLKSKTKKIFPIEEPVCVLIMKRVVKYVPCDVSSEVVS